ncbi:MAG: GNAT family N-acetyltransferase [bacterium]|nr:GNAT family N-acetyltransferase [bacterium]
MTKPDICQTLKRPFPEYKLCYPAFTIKTATSEAIEKDFIKVTDDAFNPPDKIPPKITTHEDFESDIAEGYYTRENCLVLYDNDTPVAAGQIRTEEQNGQLIGFIDTLGVPKALARRGYGEELTKHRIQMLVLLGVSEIRTDVEENNLPMLKMLRKLGFLTAPTS